VDEAFDAGFELHEGTVSVMLVTRPLKRVPTGISPRCPARPSQLLHAERCGGLVIDLDDFDLHLRADITPRRVIDAPPGDIGDVQSPSMSPRSTNVVVMFLTTPPMT
jgi:hypothetical protein